MRKRRGYDRVAFIDGDFIVSEKICIFDLFPKAEKDYLTQLERATLMQIVKTIGEELRK